MSEGIDFSWARPGAAAIVAAGKKFVMRYLYPDGQGGKGLDASEVADYRNHGLLIGVVYESSGARALAGYAAGAADAHTSVGQLESLGMGDIAVYFAVDFNATPAQYGAIGSYLDGAASVLGVGRTGLYAGFGPIDALVGVHCKYGWQTYAWSAGRVSSKAHVYQYRNGQVLNGGSVDFCRNLQSDFGAYGGIGLSGDTITPIPTDTPAVIDLLPQFGGAHVALVMNRSIDNVIAVYDESHWQEFSYTSDSKASATVKQYQVDFALGMVHSLPNVPYDALAWDGRSNRLPALKRPLFEDTGTAIVPITVSAGTGAAGGLTVADLTTAVQTGTDAVIAKLPKSGSITFD